jgi:hypothetical protein
MKMQGLAKREGKIFRTYGFCYSVIFWLQENVCTFLNTTTQLSYPANMAAYMPSIFKSNVITFSSDFLFLRTTRRYHIFAFKKT